MNALEKNLRFGLGTFIGNSRLLFSINYWRKPYKKKIIRRYSDCCIEGFHRSGNSFFVTLFRRKNRDIQLAHHTHAAGQVLRAVDYGVPTIVLIRHPRDAVASLLAWDVTLDPGIALRAYSDFYQHIRPVLDDCLLIRFTDIINRHEEVVIALNDRYGTTFQIPHFKQQQLEKIKSRVIERHKSNSAPLPTKEKEQLKKLYFSTIIKHKNFAKADEIYQELLHKTHRW